MALVEEEEGGEAAHWREMSRWGRWRNVGEIKDREEEEGERMRRRKVRIQRWLGGYRG